MSEIRATTISNAAGTGPATLTGQSAAKAWVNFNATTTLTIRNSLNTSSVTDNGVGNYHPNFANAFIDAGYCQSAFGHHYGGVSLSTSSSSSDETTSGFSVFSYTCSGTLYDNEYFSVSIHGD